MLKKFGLVALGLMVVPFVLADFLVLTNGRVIEIQGTHQVKGQFVIYHDVDGEMLQLPLKVVDLEASKAHTEAVLAAQEAAKNEPAPEPRKEEAKSLNQLVNYVTDNRDEDKPLPTDVQITGKTVQNFTDANPTPQNTAMETGGVQPNMSVDQVKRERTRFKEEADKIKAELKTLDQQIAETQKRITNLENLLVVGDDPTSSTYDSRENMVKQLNDLQAKRSAKQQELDKLSRSARSVGIRDVNRPERQRRSDKKTFKEDLGSYESGGKDEFKYVEEDAGGE